MDLNFFIKKAHRLMPEAVLSNAISHINWAYKKLVTQDLDCFLFYGGKSAEDYDGDPFTKYPILYKLDLEAYTPGEITDENPLLNKDWVTFITPKSTSVDGIKNSSSIEFAHSWGDVVDNVTFVNSYKYPIKMNVYDIPIVVRKIKSIFTFKGFLLNNISGIGDKPFASPGLTNVSFGNFVSIPFTQVSRTAWTPCRLSVQSGLTDLRSPVFVEFFFEPPDITNEFSPCIIDLNKYGDMLIEGAVGDYEEEINSNSMRKLRFENELIPKFSKAQNINANTMTKSRYEPLF